MSAPEPRRLLVISYHFPPDGAVGGLRWFGLTKHLARLGWEIDVVTSAVGADAAAVPGVTVHVRERRVTANDRYRAYVARRGASDRAGTASSAGSAHVGSGAAPSAQRLGPVQSARKLVGASLAFPDQARGWVLRAARTARDLLGRHRYDLVITSGPPHSVHFAGMLATLGRRVPHWVDMRDPWSTMVGTIPINSTVTRPLRSIQMLQDVIFSHAKRVIVNNQAFAAALRAAEPQMPIAAIANAVDTEKFPPRTDARFDDCSVAHIGTLYAGRSVTSILEAMRLLVAQHPEARSKFRLRLAGHMDPGHRARFESDLAASGITDMVRIEGVLKRADALDMLVRSQIALVLAQDQPLCVPAKLYECIGLTVPTLVVAEPGSASAVEAQRLGAMTADPADANAILRVLSDALAGRLPASAQAAAPIAYAAAAADVDRLIRTELDGDVIAAVPQASPRAP